MATTCPIHARRHAVRDRRRGATADAVHRQRAAQDGVERREHARRGPAGCPCDREDLYLRSEPAERIHRRANIAGAVYRGTAGVFVRQLIPGVPLGLAFTCVFAAVPGALVAAPFSVVLLAAFVSQVGGLQTAAVLIAVVTDCVSSPWKA